MSRPFTSPSAPSAPAGAAAPSTVPAVFFFLCFFLCLFFASSPEGAAAACEAMHSFEYAVTE